MLLSVLEFSELLLLSGGLIYNLFKVWKLQFQDLHFNGREKAEWRE